MNQIMRQDRYHIEMEDVSGFSLERSYDCLDWEEITYELVREILDPLEDEKVKIFLNVLRSGSTPRLGGFFYRIRPQDVIFS